MRKSTAIFEKQATNEKSEMRIILKILIMVFCVLLIYDYYHKNTPAKVRLSDPKFSLLRPSNTVSYNLHDNSNQLIDLKDFFFKVNPQPCSKHGQSGFLLLIIVTSKPDNFLKRSVIRKTWGKSTDSTVILFLLGETTDSDLSKHISDEILLHGDIVQGNFLDSYRNMTYKHVMGLKWVAHHCRTAKYVLKTDDDVVVNSAELRRFLARELSPWGATDLIMCQVSNKSRVQRADSSKWKVTTEEFPGTYYPTYCAGWAILYSQDVVPRLLSALQSIPYFWIDDVQVTGVAAEKLSIVHTPLTSLILSPHRADLLTRIGPQYVGQFILGPYNVGINKIKEVWKAISA